MMIEQRETPRLKRWESLKCPRVEANGSTTSEDVDKETIRGIWFATHFPRARNLVR
jgi:hypothetical protein